MVNTIPKSSKFKFCYGLTISGETILPSEVARYLFIFLHAPKMTDFRQSEVEERYLRVDIGLNREAGIKARLEHPIKSNCYLTL